MSQGGNGRDHNPHGFTMWFAGGGVKGGQVLGQTDEIGVCAVKDRYHMRDFHATILRLLGIEQNGLWYLYNGRNEKLADFGGNESSKCSPEHVSARFHGCFSNFCRPISRLSFFY